MIVYCNSLIKLPSQESITHTVLPNDQVRYVLQTDQVMGLGSSRKKTLRTPTNVRYVDRKQAYFLTKDLEP